MHPGGCWLFHWLLKYTEVQWTHEKKISSAYLPSTYTNLSKQLISVKKGSVMIIINSIHPILLWMFTFFQLHCDMLSLYLKPISTKTPDIYSRILITQSWAHFYEKKTKTHFWRGNKWRHIPPLYNLYVLWCAFTRMTVHSHNWTWKVLFCKVGKESLRWSLTKAATGGPPVCWSLTESLSWRQTHSIA